MVRAGLFHVMEGRRVFEDLTVEENLLVGQRSADAEALRADVQRLLKTGALDGTMAPPRHSAFAVTASKVVAVPKSTIIRFFP